MSDERQWATVDRYLGDVLMASDSVLDAVLAANSAAGLPAWDVSPLQGKLLHLLVRAAGARRILEIGTLGGYSTVWLARAVVPGGRIITLEVDGDWAEVARSNLRRAGMADVVDVRVGRALDLLPRLAAEGAAPFDFVFIDADKPNNSAYLDWAIRLSRVGSLIVCDNVIRGGAVLDPDSADPSVQGVRSFFELLRAERRVSATAIQTVGAKGYDGFAVAVVTAV
jgi:predicted O-methyltransferase YrrM